MNQFEPQVRVGVVFLSGIAGHGSSRRADIGKAALRHKFVPVDQVRYMFDQPLEAVRRTLARRQRPGSSLPTTLFAVLLPHNVEDCRHQRLRHRGLVHERVGAGHHGGSSVATLLHDGQNDDFGRGQLCFEDRDEPQPRRTLQVQVEQDHVGSECQRLRHGRFGVTGNTDNRKCVLILEKLARHVEKIGAIVDEKDPDWVVAHDCL